MLFSFPQKYAKCSHMSASVPTSQSSPCRDSATHPEPSPHTVSIYCPDARTSFRQLFFPSCWERRQRCTGPLFLFPGHIGRRKSDGSILDTEFLDRPDQPHSLQGCTSFKCPRPGVPTCGVILSSPIPYLSMSGDIFHYRNWRAQSTSSRGPGYC